MPLLKQVLFLTLFLVFQSCVGIIGAAAVLNNKYADTIQQGISVEGIPVGGLNVAEAVPKLEHTLPPPAENTLVISREEKSYAIKLPDIDGTYDYLATVGEAFAYGKKGDMPAQLLSTLRLRATPVDFQLKIAYSEEKLADQIRNIQKEWDIAPVNATIRLINGEAVIIAEKPGYRLDFEKTSEQTRRALDGGRLHVTAAGQILEPEISAALLAGTRTLLSEYVTYFDAQSDWNRAHNIALASAAVDGTLLQPGEIFSLNRQIGPRLAETGYLKAPVFMNNRLVQDIGGGVCQVATTLYNAALLADLAIKERYPHPSPVSYVPAGRDATIASDYLDLKFSNNQAQQIYISSVIESGKLAVRIFGAAKEAGRSVRIYSESVEVSPNVVTYYDQTLPEGETVIKDPGKKGYRAWVYRESVLNNQVESRTLISSDYYAPQDKIVLIGVKPVGSNIQKPGRGNK